MPRKTLVALAAACSRVALVAGCGGSDNGTGSRSKPAPAASEFPSAKGKTLRQIVLRAGRRRAPSSHRRPATSTSARTASPSASSPPAATQITDATGRALRRAGQGRRRPGDRSLPGADRGPHHQALLPGQDHRRRSRAAQVAYVTDIPLDKPGPWAFAALIKSGGSYQYSLLPTPNPVGDYPMPQVGQPAPVVHTLDRRARSPTSPRSTRGSRRTTCTATTSPTCVGKKPVVLLFATPALCQSRVCGPVTDIAEQVKQEFGDRVAFIHQEIYNNNSINDGPRPQMRAFHLDTEPWAYVIDRSGQGQHRPPGTLQRPGARGSGPEGRRLATGQPASARERVELHRHGGPRTAQHAGRRGRAAHPDDHRPVSRSSRRPARRTPARIEELRVEAHGLKGAALVVGQNRLADLAREIEQFLAGCVETGRIQPGAAAPLVAACQRFQRGRPGGGGGRRRALLGRRFARRPLRAPRRLQSGRGGGRTRSPPAPSRPSPATPGSASCRSPPPAARGAGMRARSARPCTPTNTSVAQMITGAAISVRAGASTLSSRDRPTCELSIATRTTITSEL